MSTTTLHIEGLGATAATAHIEKALESVPHVEAVRMDTGASCAVVEHDGQAETDKLVGALKSLGYDQVRPE